MHKDDFILTINAGSSSIKFALYPVHNEARQNLSGRIERIGSPDAKLTVNQHTESEEKIDGSSFQAATLALMSWFEKQDWFDHVKAVGHRIVHGMKHTQAEIITDDLLKELNSIVEYDPDHLPEEIEIVQALQKKRPNLVQIACFDTAFHTKIPPVAKTFAIPKKYYDEGVQRYGFHGISYSYLMQKLKNQNEAEANGRIILLHLGSGASLAAVKDGKCVDTSMGFTPAGGIVMSTRSGDLDPGVAWYLMKQGMDEKAFNTLINRQSGLLGISGVSADMEVLLQPENENKDTALAVDIFCYQIKKYIGAYTAALGGLDTLVFSGGIGEHSPQVRSKICDNLEFLGIDIDEIRNMTNKPVISTEKSKVEVHVIKTNEELMIAKMVYDILMN